MKACEWDSHFARILPLLGSRFIPIARVITHKMDWRDCMRKAVFAGAVALATMGPLFVSEKGIGPAPALAQEGVDICRAPAG